MFKVTIRPQWQIAASGGRHVLPQIIALLGEIHSSGQLAAASRRTALSYRYAWGLLRAGEEIFGSPLVDMQRGRGTRLTTLGEKLVWADKRITARLGPLLDSLASELESEIQRTVSESQGILCIHASHGFAVETLREFLVRRDMPVDLQYRGSLDALASLARSSCDVAGFHVPVGDFETHALQQYEQWLKPDRQRLIHLATRRQGLMVAPGNPRRIRRLADLTRPNVRFVNRQSGSGTRMLLELLLAKHKVDGHRISGYDTGEFTHAAVAAYVASGMADAGFGIETPARRFDLEFLPMATERYFFICDESSLAAPAVSAALEVMRSGEFKAAVNRLPGYDASACGQVLDIAAAFPGYWRSGPRI